MLISLILPIYNVEKYLRQCLDSIEKQSYKNLEIICINDCSTDSSLRILEEYATQDSRIRIINNAKNLGVGLSRNIGIKAAKGEYIHFIDPDDWIEPEIYQKLLTYTDKNIDLVYFKYNSYNNLTGELTKIEFKNKAIIGKILNPLLDYEAFDNWDRYVWSRLYRREFLLENNVFFDNYVSLSDVKFAALTYVNCKSLIYINEFCINYRRFRDGSLVQKGYKSYKGIIESFEYNRKLYKNLPDELKYKLLGFDYYQIKNNIEIAYRNNYINWFDILVCLSKVNRPETQKYKYEDMESNVLILSFWKLVLKKHTPKLFNVIIKIKKQIRSYLSL